MPTATIPQQNNLNRQSGTLVLRLSCASVPSEAHLLTTGAFSLWYKGGAFVLQTSPTLVNKQLSLYTTPFPGEATLVWTWIENNHRLLCLETNKEISVFSSALNESFGTLDLAVAPYFPGSYRGIELHAADQLYAPAGASFVPGLESTASKLFSADYTQPQVHQQPALIESTFAPQDGSPILVSDPSGPFRRHFFFDLESGAYTETNTETFVYRGETTLYLAYDGLDPQFRTQILLRGEAIGEPLNVSGNAVLLTSTPEQRKSWYGEEISVTYRLARSYSVEYNEDTALDSFRLVLPNHENQPVTITQEGNRFSNQRLAREIELNPIVNPRHTGFLYLSKEEQRTESFRLSLSSEYLIANGVDSADFIVELLDSEGNEVLAPYLDVFLMDENGQQAAGIGSLAPVMNRDTLKARQAAGRCYFRYQAPLIRKSDQPLTQKIFAVAYDRKHKIGAQLPLFLRPSEPVYTANGEDYLNIAAPLTTSPDAAIVFEYVARYYERAIPADSAVALFDQDGDGSLGRSDLEQLLQEQGNDARMKELAAALLAKEAF